MNIEKQVVSLEISQRLEALGVAQTSEYKWMNAREEFSIYHVDSFRSTIYDPLEWNIALSDGYAAYTVAELIEFLGDNFLALLRIWDGSFSAANSYTNFLAATPANALGLLLERVVSEVK